MNKRTEYLEVDLIFNRFINFIMQQNHVPVIRKLTIKNIGDSNLNNIRIQIVPEPVLLCSRMPAIQRAINFLRQNLPQQILLFDEVRNPELAPINLQLEKKQNEKIIPRRHR